MKRIKHISDPRPGQRFTRIILHTCMHNFQLAVLGWSQMCLRASLTSLWQTVQRVCRLSREHCPPPPDTGLMWSTCQKCPSPGFLISSLSCNKNTASAVFNTHCGNCWFSIVPSCLHSKITGKNTLGWFFIAFIVSRKNPLGQQFESNKKNMSLKKVPPQPPPHLPKPILKKLQASIKYPVADSF